MEPAVPVAPPDAGEAPFLDVARSSTGRAWRARGGDPRQALAIAQKLGLPEVLGRVLAARGVDVDGAAAFLNPLVRDTLPDPSTFRDMDKAVARTVHAVRGRETIGVFGDYDVDGATSSALLLRFFRALGVPTRLYIPDRLREGYGPNADAFEQLRAESVGLVITLDCGTVAHEALGAAAAAGLDVIVLDHHEAEAALPPALAVVNPNRLDEDAGFGEVAAVGIAFLFVVGVNRALRESGWYRAAGRDEPDLLGWLDLVALGTVCDVVPLVGLNRALVAQGLKIMAGRRNIGLAALAEVARIDAAPTAYHAGYLLGPRINAGGRVGRADLGARLLATADEAEAATIAAELDALNHERRAIEAEVLAEAESRAAALIEAAADKPPLILVWGEGWHPGVIGIVASRLKDRFHRPVFVIAVEDGIGKGSGRSIRGVDLGAAVIAARQSGLLVAGGGHAMAAGLTVEADKLDALYAFFHERLAPAVAAVGDAPPLAIDAALSVRGATPDLVALIAHAGPFGAGNPRPRFAVPGARIVRAEVVGADHVRCLLAGADGGRLPAIAFRAASGPLGAALLAPGGARLHVAGHLESDDWQGRARVRLIVEDAAPA